MSGRGRGRGRARGQGRFPDGPNEGRPAQQQVHGAPAPHRQAPAPGWGPPQRAAGFPNPRPSQARPATGPRPQVPAPATWGVRAPRGPSTFSQPATSPQQEVTQQMQQLNLGAGSSSSSMSGSGEGGRVALASLGRGDTRGRRKYDNPFLWTRPAGLEIKRGTVGTPQNFLTNYFQLKTIPNWALQQYRVDFAPEEDRTHERKKLLLPHKNTLGNGYVFDGTMLYIPKRLTAKKGDSINLTSNNEAGDIYRITVKFVQEMNLGDYAYTQVFNLLVRSCLGALGLQLVGRDYYDANPQAKVLLQNFKMELWPGYKTSIRQHESGILMCVGITHKVMRMDTVLEILYECCHKDKDNFQREFLRKVVGCIVLTKYNNKTYRIDDVDFQKNPTHTFLWQNQDISYASYMQNKYNIKINDPHQPMLLSRAKERDVRAGLAEVIYLIPEVCHCTGLTDDMRKDYNLMNALAVHTRISPDTRIRKLLNFSERLRSNARAMEQLQRFEMTFDENLVKVPGRRFDGEKIYFNNADRPITVNDNADWFTPLRSSPMFITKTLSHWYLVVTQELKTPALNFVIKLQQAGIKMRFKIENPKIVELRRSSVGDHSQALGQILCGEHPELIMSIISNNASDQYAVIKKKCCIDYAVPTQVIQAKTIKIFQSNRIESVAAKVAVQINCKIGGAPWHVQVPLKNLMVVGFDVCHDTTSRSQSYGAMVASLDATFSRYFSVVTPHTNGEELSNSLALNIIQAVKKYQNVNAGNLPEKIIIYRDGVGEGQIPHVFKIELESIKEKLQSAYGQKPFYLAFIIVTKRINTHIFTDASNNPLPGSVVDDVITDPEKFDFFLISQSVRQGTVSPTSYNVLYNNIPGMDPDRHQRLAYKLCHMYFNWSGTVRVPAPCQYAHKLAFLIGQSVHREPSAPLADMLYFL